MTCLSRSIG